VYLIGSKTIYSNIFREKEEYMDVGTWLQQRRLEAGLKLADIQPAMNAGALSLVERGKVNPTMWTVLQVCSRLETSLDALLRDTGNVLPDPLPHDGQGLQAGGSVVCWPDIAHVLETPERGMPLSNAAHVPTVDVVATYTAGGVLLLRDVGQYITDVRDQQGWTRLRLEQQHGLSNYLLRHVEAGAMQRLLLSQALLLDEMLQQHGLLTGMFWQAYRFYQQLGITPENPQSETWNRALGALAWCRMAAGSSQTGS
jgi:transcriptional regulator with XRE-family HTH domain